MHDSKKIFVENLLTTIRKEKSVNDVYVYYDTPQGVVLHIIYNDGVKSKFFEYPNHIGTIE
jgi:hypothetical protein